VSDAPVFHVPRRKQTRQQRGVTAKAAQRRYSKKSGVFATPVGFSVRAGSTRPSVLKAAEVFLEQARRNAAKFSRRIPAATYVSGYQDQQAMIVTDGDAAPNAAPFEFAERHPLWGDRAHWYKQPRRPYMSRAASSKATVEKAADIYAAAEALLLAEEHGYTE
jgi:hypothetical protein